MMLACVSAVILDCHSIVNVRAESVLYGLDIRTKAIAGNLRTVAKARRYVTYKSIRRLVVALAYFVRGNDLSFGVNRTERPDITKRRIVIEGDMLFLLPDEPPNFVKLQIIAR